MTRTLIGPFNRVEGDLEIQLDVGTDRVREACGHLIRAWFVPRIDLLQSSHYNCNKEFSCNPHWY